MRISDEPVRVGLLVGRDGVAGHGIVERTIQSILGAKVEFHEWTHGAAYTGVGFDILIVKSSRWRESEFLARLKPGGVVLSTNGEPLIKAEP